MVTLTTKVNQLNVAIRYLGGKGNIKEPGQLAGKSFLSDTHGKITHLYMSCTTSLSSRAVELLGQPEVEERFQTLDLPRLNSILRETDKDVRVTVAYHGDDEAQALSLPLRKLQGEYPDKLQLIRMNQEMGTWVQDRLYTFNDKNIAVKASEFDQSLKKEGLPAIMFASEQLSRLGFTVCTAPLEELDQIRAADIMTSDKHIFLGFNALRITYMFAKDVKTEDHGGQGMGHRMYKDDRKALGQYERTGRIYGPLKFYAEHLAAQLESLTDKKVIFTASNKQPVPIHCDLDMFFTPLGNNVVAVADLSLAEGVRETLLKDGYHEHAAKSGDTPTDTFLLKKKEVEGFTEWLKWKGYTVVRVPFLNKLERGEEIIPWCTYNNVLMEIFADKKRIYMPVYGVEELDALAAKIYAGLGFEVRSISGIKDIAAGLGALRCSTKVLERA